jgi:hypothetical protein
MSFLPFFGFELTNSQWFILFLPIIYAVTIGFFVRPDISLLIYISWIIIFGISLIYSALSELFGFGFALSLFIAVISMFGIAILFDIFFKKNYTSILFEGFQTLFVILFFLFIVMIIIN